MFVYEIYMQMSWVLWNRACIKQTWSKVETFCSTGLVLNIQLISMLFTVIEYIYLLIMIILRIFDCQKLKYYCLYYM